MTFNPDLFTEDEHRLYHKKDMTFYSEEERDKYLEDDGYILIDETDRHQIFISPAYRSAGWAGFIAVMSTFYDDDAEYPKKWQYRLRFYENLLDAIYEYKA